LIFQINIWLKFIESLFEACFFFDFTASFLYLTAILLYWFLMHYILLAIFQVNGIKNRFFIFKFCIFISKTDRCQHTELSFIKAHYKAVGIFYAFFPWLLDGPIFAIHSRGIFLSIIWFGLNNSHNCKFVSNSPLF